MGKDISPLRLPTKKKNSEKGLPCLDLHKNEEEEKEDDKKPIYMIEFGGWHLQEQDDAGEMKIGRRRIRGLGFGGGFLYKGSPVTM